MNEQLEETKRVRLILTEDPRTYVIVNLTVDKIRERIARIKKNLYKLSNILASTEAKLNNKDFLKNAPPDVIESEYMKYASFKPRIYAIKEELKHLELVLKEE